MDDAKGTDGAVTIIDAYELSPLQQGMVFHALSTPGLGVHVEQITIETRDEIDVPTFEHAFRTVMQRHPILRTRFRWRDLDEPRQEVLAEVELAATVADWRHLEPEAARRRFEVHRRADRRDDFDLSEAPLMRLFVAHCPGGGSRVLWTWHHLLGDGRSFVVLLEWFALYDAARRGESVELPPARPYRDYIVWRRTLDHAAAERFWRSDLETLEAPTSLGLGAPGVTQRGADPFGTVQRRLSRDDSDRLRAAAARWGVTVNTMLQAAWAVLLRRYGGESDVVFGATRTGRWTGSDETAVRIGLFINTLPMRVTVDDDAEIGSLLQTLRARQVALRPYEHTSLAAVHGCSSVARGTPLFESVVVYDHKTLDSFIDMPGRRFEYAGQTNFPLTLLAYGDDEMLLRLQYSTERFTDAAMARMLGHVVNLLSQLAGGTVTTVGDLDPLDAEERAALVGTPATSVACRDRTLHGGFMRQAAATPDAVAVTAGTGTERVELTYGELDRRTSALASRLRELGVTDGDVVGLRVERTADVVVGMLGILKAGAAYLPLDPVHPPDRAAFMVQDAGARIVLTRRALAGRLAALGVRCLSLDEPLPATAPVAPLPTSGDLAYVMYTSGSTGTPKGVPITHHNVMRLFAATAPWFPCGTDDVWALFHSYSFDISVWETWGALLTGGRLVVVSQDTSRDPVELHAVLRREGVTMLCQTPTAFRSLAEADAAAPQATALRTVIFVGEALEPHLLTPWMDRHGDASPELVNMYGPTETTVYAAYRPITRADLSGGSVIGVPLPDLRCYVLDDRLRPVPDGVPGELFVAGDGVAGGYLGRPELTAERFLPNPFHAGTMYRTGDVVRRLDDGDLEYLGRVDQQVKIRGFRVEPGEVEAAIAEHPDVRQVAVVPRKDADGQTSLIAYLVADGDHDALDAALRGTLRTRLPEYMVPTHFVTVDALPRNANGKLDRAALPAPETSGRRPRAAVDPRSRSEELVVAVFSEVLHRGDIGVLDDFFDLGGHSLSATRVMTKLSDRTGVRLSMRNLFERSTPEGLALAIDALTWTAATHRRDSDDDRMDDRMAREEFVL